MVPRLQAPWGDDTRSYYRILSQFHFVLSPPGNGLDCFRTWDALAVGTVPIVKRQGPMDRMYDKLPVLLVDKWDDVTLPLLYSTLERWRRELPPGHFDFGQITIERYERIVRACPG